MHDTVLGKEDGNNYTTGPRLAALLIASLSDSVINIKTKSNTGRRRRRFLSTYNSQVTPITEGSQDRNSKPARTWRQKHQCRDGGGVLLTGLSLMACLSCSLIQPRPTCPQVAMLPVCWLLPCLPLINKMPHRLAHRPVWVGGDFLRLT